MNTIAILTMSILFQQSAYSKLNCSWFDGPEVTKICPKKKPRYFFDLAKIDGTEYILYISPEGNIALNTETGLESSLPGKFDPVAVGDLLTVPRNIKVGVEWDYQLHFYSLKDQIAGDDEKPLFVDTELTGVYQSISNIESNQEEVRALVESEDGVKIRDYKYNKSTSVIGPKTKVKIICKGRELKTPKLSSDGLHITGYDIQSSSSKVIYIGRDGHSCDEIYDFGTLVGKADYNHKDRKAHFHVSAQDLNYGGAGAYSEPARLTSFNSFTVNTDTGEMTQISKNSYSASYYPLASKDSNKI